MRTTCLLALVGMLGSGCAAHASFKPETIDVNGHTLVIKGWTGAGEFCIELRLKSEDKKTSLYAVSVVTPDGRRLDPATWRDETPEPPRIGLGFGLGLGGIGRGGHHGGDHGGRAGWGVVPGVGTGVPLGGGKDGRITAVKACWKLADVATPITDCTLDVSVVSYVLKKAEVTTAPLAMTLAAAPEPETQPSAPKDAGDDEKSVKDLVREIDFTAKGPPEKRDLER